VRHAPLSPLMRRPTLVQHLMAPGHHSRLPLARVSRLMIAVHRSQKLAVAGDLRQQPPLTLLPPPQQQLQPLAVEPRRLSRTLLPV
jgi:hypothetical protein